jgi:hypothetical protein
VLILDSKKNRPMLAQETEQNGDVLLWGTFAFYLQDGRSGRSGLPEVLYLISICELFDNTQNTIEVYI